MENNACVLSEWHAMYMHPVRYACEKSGSCVALLGAQKNETIRMYMVRVDMILLSFFFRFSFDSGRE